ncbi:DUF4282 domain-containing protein [Brevibacterium sp. FAM 24638]|uniref:DUF4282 domain-containing protein n=1 Tax=Brevibacterium sp. FAM 24638 TaxID=3415681 RepID=UPI003C7D1247
MSTPQNPNDPNSSSAEQNLDGQSTGTGDQPQSTQPASDQSASGQDAQTPEDAQYQPGQDAHQGQDAPHQSTQEAQAVQDAQPGYQQGTYDPTAYQAQGQPYQQAGYSQPGAYQQDPYQQDPYQQDPYQQGVYSQGAPQQQAYGQPVYGQPAYGQAPQSTPQRAGFFKSLFDIRFDSFIAVKWAGFIYIIAIVVAALSYLGTIIAGISAGVAAGSAAAYFTDGPSFNVLPLILSIVFGWIIPALWVIGVRLVLELIVSNIKTAENTKRIADSVSR